MTREELRDYVDEQRTLNNIPYHVYSALIDGIDTLEQEPSGDCISRQAVLNTEYRVKIINDIEYVMLSEVQMKMRKLPSVKPQEPTSEQVEEYCRKRCLTLVSNEFMAHIIADSGNALRN
jgi:hypothetical protein